MNNWRSPFVIKRTPSWDDCFNCKIIFVSTYSTRRTSLRVSSYVVVEHHRDGFYILDLNWYDFVFCLGSLPCKMFCWLVMRSSHSSRTFCFWLVTKTNFIWLSTVDLRYTLRPNPEPGLCPEATLLTVLHLFQRPKHLPSHSCE